MVRADITTQPTATPSTNNFTRSLGGGTFTKWLTYYNSLGLKRDTDKILFDPYFITKYIVGFVILFAVLPTLSLKEPYILGDPDNFTPANSLVTPVHMQPELYFLFTYAILRSIPNKLGRVNALVISIAILFIMPIYKSKFKGKQFYPLNQLELIIQLYMKCRKML
jgi:ubiquinol-cytochrome c reductase cytochrome b subunit